MGGAFQSNDDRGERWQHRLQLFAFLGALLILAAVIYVSVVSRASRREEESRAVTATVLQQAQLATGRWYTAVEQATLAVQELLTTRNTPVILRGKAISAMTARRTRQIARWGKGIITDVAWAPDGRTLAVGSSIGIYLHSIETGAEGYVETRSGVSQLAFSLDGQSLAAVLLDGEVWIWKTPAGTPLRTIDDAVVAAIAFPPEGGLIMAGLDERGLWLRRDGQEQALRSEGAVSGEMTSMAISPNGHFLAVGWNDGTVQLWQATRKSLVNSFSTRQEYGPQNPVFSPDGRTLASGAGDMVRVWSVDDGGVVQETGGHEGDPIHLAFSSTGLLATGDREKVRIYERSSGSLLRAWEGPTGVNRLAFSPDGKLLACAQVTEGVIQLWQIKDGASQDVLTGYGAPVASLAFSPDGKLLVSASLGGAAWLWQLTNGVSLQVLRQERSSDLPAGAVAFSPDGQVLVSGAGNSVTSFWQVQTEPLSQTEAVPVDRPTTKTLYFPPVDSISFSPDGKILAAGWAGGKVLLWSMADDLLLRVLDGHLASSDVCCMGFSPDGTLLATATTSGTVALWQVEGGRWLSSFQETGEVNSVVFSPDGQLLAIAAGTAIRLRQVEDGALLRTFEGHGSPVRSLAFSPDGTVLASGAWDGSVGLWQISEGNCLAMLSRHTAMVSALAFSADGHLLASGSHDGTVRLWGVR